MTRIIPIGSGSSGNSVYIEIDGFRALVDVGLSCRTIVSALRANQITPESLHAVLITHTHIDHIRGLSVLAKRLQCPIIASTATCDMLCEISSTPLAYAQPLEVQPGCNVTAFRTPHDCIGSAGYIIETPQVKLGYATDLGVMTDEIRSMLQGSDIIVLESNHDTDMLRYGPYPVYLKRRILSENGHLSNEACAFELKKFASSGTKHFFLAHLSRENNTPALALSAAAKAAQGLDVTIEVMPVQNARMYCYE